MERVDPTDLAVGDVVSMKIGPEHAVFTHRIIRIVERDDGLWIETKGDANTTADPAITPIVGRQPPRADHGEARRPCLRV